MRGAQRQRRGYPNAQNRGHNNNANKHRVVVESLNQEKEPQRAVVRFDEMC